MATPPLRRARHILVCLRYGIGDVVMQFPALEVLRAAAPKARITGAGAKPAVELLDRARLVDEIVAYSRWGIRHLWDAGAEQTVSQIVGWLGEAGFELVLDAAHAPDPMWHAVRRTGVPTLSTDEAVLLAELARGVNGTEALARAMRSGWGLPVEPRPDPVMTLSDSEVEFARVSLGLTGSYRSRVGFCPAASSKLKQWPESCFAAVADWVVENTGRGVVLLGGDLDESVPAMRQLMSHGARAIEVRGFHLRRVAALLSQCAALVTNDTGLMHMAAAVRTPVVAVFGPTNPKVYLPHRQAIGLASDLVCPHRAHGFNPPGCWPGERCLIAPHSCTVTVSTERVIAALRGVLRRAPALPK